MASTLIRIVHSWVLTRSDRERAWQLFRQALASDIEGIQGGTTSEGIHLGAMAGTVDLMQRGHTGIEMHDDVLWLNSHLPAELAEVRLRIRYRGRWLQLDVRQKGLWSLSWRKAGPLRLGSASGVMFTSLLVANGASSP